MNPFDASVAHYLKTVMLSFPSIVFIYYKKYKKKTTFKIMNARITKIHVWKNVTCLIFKLVH